MKSLQLCSILLLLLSCSTSKNARLTYSTSSEEALAQFRKGWVQIMDEGRYGAAEDSYRNAIAHDPDFLVGKSVLARLTLDLEERLTLEKELFEKQEAIQGDERLVLDVYNMLVRYTNLRDQNDPKAREVLQKAMKIAEENLGQLAHKYPQETHLKAEYIEFLHARYGAENALDSLSYLILPEQRTNPFLMGLDASLHAEINDFDTALRKADELAMTINDSTQPKPYAVYAFIHLEKGDLQLAKINADKAHALDPLNLDASRLKKRIDTQIKEQKIAQEPVELH